MRGSRRFIPSMTTTRSGTLLRDARLSHGASIRAVARAAGVAPSTVIRWERTLYLPKAPTRALRNIALALSVRLFESSRPVWKGPHAQFFSPDLKDRVVSTCNARTRSGDKCKNAPTVGKRRCRLHGGLSTGPRTMAGRLKCSYAARNMWERRRGSQ